MSNIVFLLCFFIQSINFANSSRHNVDCVEKEVLTRSQSLFHVNLTFQYYRNYNLESLCEKYENFQNDKSLPRPKRATSEEDLKFKVNEIFDDYRKIYRFFEYLVTNYSREQLEQLFRDLEQEKGRSRRSLKTISEWLMKIQELYDLHVAEQSDRGRSFEPPVLMDLKKLLATNKIAPALLKEKKVYETLIRMFMNEGALSNVTVASCTCEEGWVDVLLRVPMIKTVIVDKCTNNGWLENDFYSYYELPELINQLKIDFHNCEEHRSSGRSICSTYTLSPTDCTEESIENCEIKKFPLKGAGLSVMRKVNTGVVFYCDHTKYVLIKKDGTRNHGTLQPHTLYNFSMSRGEQMIFEDGTVFQM